MRVTMKVNFYWLAALATSISVSGCHGEDPSPPAIAELGPLPTYDEIWSSDWENPLPEKPDKVSKVGCPLFTKDTAQRFLAPHAQAETYWRVDEDSVRLACDVEAFHRTGARSSKNEGISLTLLQVRVDEWNNTLAVDSRFRAKPGSKNLLQSLHDKYPGYGIAYSATLAMWACGRNYLTLQMVNPGDVLEQKFLDVSGMLTIVEQPIRLVCGTTTTPSATVTDAPWQTWKIFDTYGGVSPTKYGIKRPDSRATSNSGKQSKQDR